MEITAVLINTIRTGAKVPDGAYSKILRPHFYTVNYAMLNSAATENFSNFTIK